MSLLNRQERQTVLALSGGVEMHLRVVVTEAEREAIRERAAADNLSVSQWAAFVLVDEAARP